MKGALSNKLMSTLVKVSISSVRRAINNTVRQALMRSFVPLYLGFESITREQIIKDHTRPLAKTLLDANDDNMILINTLKTYVEENNLQRRTAQWKPIEDSAIPFPQLTDEQLRSLTFGVYQLKLSSSYIQEYMEGDSQICVYKDANDLIRIRIQSRAHVVGVCAHVTAIIWYLSSARNAATKSYGVQDWSTYLSDAKNLPETIISSESETESIGSVIEE
ncbi:unnamed protein product [Mytilus coruscus]|uniref:Uncharacterized protein n=1 Tax=Mytilus coruscus TaxID=42192 RepID=A0A6J8D1T8_MYTCO|nr:unnamed protein product [Mytilus coruscus]